MRARALHNVSFEIEKGEICVVVGQSEDAGKTTLLNILGGMDTLTEGHVLLDGRDISTLNEKQMATYRRFDIGFVFQFLQSDTEPDSGRECRDRIPAFEGSAG